LNNSVRFVRRFEAGNGFRADEIVHDRRPRDADTHTMYKAALLGS
jgi:hypothetical protein